MASGWSIQGVFMKQQMDGSCFLFFAPDKNIGTKELRLPLLHPNWAAGYQRNIWSHSGPRPRWTIWMYKAKMSMNTIRFNFGEIYLSYAPLRRVMQLKAKWLSCRGHLYHWLPNQKGCGVSIYAMQCVISLYYTVWYTSSIYFISASRSICIHIIYSMIHQI